MPPPHSPRLDSERLPAYDLLLVARRLAASADDATAAFRTLVESGRSLLDADGCLIASRHGTALRVDAATGSLAPLEGRTLPVGRSILVESLEARRTWVTHDRDIQAALGEHFGEIAPVRHLITTPLELGDGPPGVLVVTRAGDPSFSDEHAALAAHLAGIGSLAIRSARLLERERQTARESRALSEIVRHLNQSLELERVVTLIAEHACDLLGGQGATVMMADGDQLHFVGTAGHARNRFTGSYSVDDAFSGLAIRTGVPHRTSDLTRDPRWGATARLLDGLAANAIVAPLMVGDRAIGTVLVYGNTTRDFNEHDEELLQALASHAAIAVENARLYRAAARTARHAEILAAAGRTLSSLSSPAGVFDGISSVATVWLGVDGFTVYAVDAVRRVSSLTHSYGVGGVLTRHDTANLWRGFTRRAIDEREEVAIEDLRTLDEQEQSPELRELLDAGTRAVAMLPLVVDAEVRGLLLLCWSTRRTFDTAERELLGDFAAHVAIALRNAGLLGDLERRAARFAAVAGVQQAIARTALEDVYTAVYRAARRSVPNTTVFAIALASADRSHFLPQLVVVAGERIRGDGLRTVPCATCAASRALTTVEPAMSDSPCESWYESATTEVAPPPRSEIAVPIVHGGEARGVLVMQSADASAFDADDAEVLALIARQAGAAIENARLFEAERHARSVAEGAAAIARSALASAPPDEASATILEIVDRTVPSAGKALALLLEDGGTLSYLAATGDLARLRMLRVPRADSAVQLLTGAAGAVMPVPGALAALREAGMIPEAAVAYPLVARERVLGVLWSLPAASARPRDGDLESLGRLAAHVAVAADVMLLAEEERKRRERERMLATALATMEQPVFILGLDRRVLYANAAAVREYRYPAEQLAGLDFDSLVTSAVAPRRLPGAPLPATPAGVWRAEHVHRRSDGTQFPASVMLSYIRDDADVLVGQVVTVRNLTDEHRIEEQLRQSEKLAALGELVAGVAHELNNPLAGISAFAQLLLEEELGEEQHDSVRLIKREADRAVGVIRDLLIFSRKAGPSRAPVELNEIVELTLRLRNYSLRSAGVEVHTQLDRAIPPVRGDDQRLQQVLLNLIVNAEHALQRASTKRLVVRTERTDGGLVLSVADTGVGMPEETRQRIFEPFFTTKPAGQGTGLGLSVSYGIIQAHGGSISVVSEPGSGTEFRVFLPAAGSASNVAIEDHD